MSSMTRRRTTRDRRRVARIRGILATAAAVSAAIVLGAGAAGSTYALWNGRTTADAANISTGSIELLVDGQTSAVVTGLDLSPLYPGSSVVRASPLVIKNAGTVPLSVSWTGTEVTSPVTALPSHVIASLRPTTAPTCTLTPDGTPLPTTLTPFTLAPSATATVCLEVRLSASAPGSVMGAGAQIRLTLTGDQVRP